MINNPNSNINLPDMAKSVAKKIQEQLGLVVEDISQQSRDLVRVMVLQAAPDIPPEHLEILLDHWVPKKKDQGEYGALPQSLLRTMVLQFLQYSKGEMTDEELQDLPEGWQEKYWDAFPREVRRLIAGYLKGQIPGDMFIQGIDIYTREDKQKE